MKNNLLRLSRSSLFVALLAGICFDAQAMKPKKKQKTSKKKEALPTSQEPSPGQIIEQIKKALEIDDQIKIRRLTHKLYLQNNLKLLKPVILSGGALVSFLEAAVHYDCPEIVDNLIKDQKALNAIIKYHRDGLLWYLHDAINKERWKVVHKLLECPEIEAIFREQNKKNFEIVGSSDGGDAMDID